MRYLACIVMLALAGSAAAAPPSTFDIVAYQLPAGWRSEVKNGVLSLQASNDKARTFALVLVTPSAASRGSLDRDFRATWDAAIAGGYHVREAPKVTPGASQDGWDTTSGVARGAVEGVAAGFALVTMTGHGRTLSIIVITNSDAYSAAVDGLLGSVKLRKADDAPALPPAPPPAAGARTTSFGDGWTATGEADAVRVTRPGATVLLHFAVPLTDESRGDTAGYFWTKLVAPRHTVTATRPLRYSAIDFPYYVVEGEVRDGGVPGFVALRVVVSNGVAFPIEVQAASRAAYLQLFPDQSKLEAIRGANRFALGADVAGVWESSTSAAVNMYVASTGNYAGLNAAATYDRFELGASGAYKSVHKGATGMVGSQKMYQGTIQGSYTTGPWELKVKQQDGKVVVYDASYELVRGGRLLHLTNRAYTGMAYTLMPAR